MSVARTPSTNKGQNILQIVIGGGISLVFLWLAFRGVDWRGAWQVISRANIALLLAALVSVLVTTFIRSERWRLMFYPRHRGLRPRSFFTIFLIGQVINAVIPARVGGMARAYLIGEREGVSKAHALWTTLVERVIDALTLLVFLAAISLLVPLPGWVQSAGWTLGGLSVLVIVALGIFLAFRAPATRWIEATSARYPRLQRLRPAHLLAVVGESLALMREPALCWGLSAWSILAFLAGAVTNWLIGLALGLPVSFLASLLLLAVLQISAVAPIPTSPGRVGLFHYLCIITLAIFGIERNAALGYGLVLHVIFYLPMTVGGPLCMALHSVSWRNLSRLMRQPEAVGK